MSPIAYLFYDNDDDEPCEVLETVRQAEEKAGIKDKQRLCVIRYSELDVARLGGMGRQQPPPGSGPCVIQIIDGERHAWMNQRFTEWIGEYIEYLDSKSSESVPVQQQTHVRSSMGAGKIKVSEVIGHGGRGGEETRQEVPSQSAKASATKSRGEAPDVGACDSSIQLMEPDCFLEDFAQDGKR